ncbi:alpha-rhamnosidase [Colletotrichum truncatum]|uniref:Alpha-rhamnosidase n=1 Tax=Colletotrichum truncatum TaxID=5467 RepID=A0ACC3YKP0_COLTU|nr:alpha-rhamnosidase [Colletotrichum truncatum]KAF6783377.1 alpha-rhamnosidase [Colletotrichum truncatum]
MSCPTVTKPVFEHHHSGLGVESPRPRISWRFHASDTAVPAWVQTSYELEVTFTTDNETKVFRETNDQSVLVPWPFRDLGSRESAVVRVRVYGKSLVKEAYKAEEPSQWSEPATVEASLLEREDFRAKFITSAKLIGPHGPLRPIRFRKDFTLPEDVKFDLLSARLYITSLGVFEATINGKPVTDECMAPGWTSYRHRLVYRVLDVKNLLLPGQKNTICVEVGEGWYAGRLGFKGGIRFRYGDVIGLFAQLEVKGPKNEPWSLLTDESWSCKPSAITNSEIYDGEDYDMREEEEEDWNRADKVWDNALGTKILPWPTAKLVAIDAPPVRVIETKPCINVFLSKSGKTILDFGQNLVGKLLVKSVQLGKGEKITLRHAEVMEDGELGTRPLRDAKCLDTIIGSGKEIKDWTPKFTFHGFRFVQVDGWPSGTLSKNDIQALVMHTDMKRRGFFECSNSSVNQLHSNVVWSMRGNFLSLPTDCPQRDERLGWTGDLQVFCPTATFLYDTLGILGNWLQDVAAEQLEEGKGGIPPLVVPLAISPNWPHMAQAVWDDMTVLAPHVLYQYSSDKGLLERQFQSMQAWLDQGIDRASDGLWNPDKWQLADWLDPSAPPEDPGNGRTDSILVANAYLVHTTLVFSQLCAALGKDNLSAKYSEDGERLKTLFQRRYITPEGNLMSTSQTGLALAFQFDLYPNNSLQRQTAAKALEKLVRTARFHISTGFAGTPVISHALTTIGRPQLAYRMLLETTCPSWLFPVVSMGATTIWERWDSMLPDGRINPGQMTSLNHYALGSVADWLHGSVGGISPLEPGWKRIRVRPVPGGNITSARASFDGPYGKVAIEWTVDGNEIFKMKLIVPPSCSAVVTLPSELRQLYDETPEPSRIVYSGVHEFECSFCAGEWPPKPFVAANQPLPPDTIAE